MYTLITGSDRFTIISKSKAFEDAGYRYFHGNLSDFISLVSSTGLFNATPSQKVIVNFETSKIDLNNKFLDVLNTLNHKDNIVFIYNNTLRVKKNIKSSFDTVESYNIKDNKEIFSLIDAVFNKDEKKSLELTTKLLEKYDAFYVLSMLFYQLKNILYSYYDISRFKKLHPFVIQKTSRFSKNFSKVSSVSVLRAFVELDYKLKSTNLGEDALYSVIYFVFSI